MAKNNKNRVLSIDPSSTNIGIAVLDFNKKNKSLHYYETFKPYKKGNELDLFLSVRNYMEELFEKFKPDYIAIEDYIRFMKNNSMAATILKLASINTIICIVAFDYLGEQPTKLNVNKIRNALKFDKKAPKKEEMPGVVAKHLNIEPVFVHNKKGKIDKSTYDINDAISVGLAFIKTNF